MKLRHLLFLVAGSVCTTANAQIQVDPGPTPGDVGTVTFTYRGTQVTYTTVRAADNNIWLQHNLGSPQVATAYNDPNGYGHTFQWGRWDDGHQVAGADTNRATVLNPNNDPSGIPNGSDKFYYGGSGWWGGLTTSATWTSDSPSATNGMDPCAALGKHWRLATEPEWVNILSVENITGLASAYASNLKLTAAGWRSFDWGIYGNQGQFGNYWTSTVSPLGYPTAVQIGTTTGPDLAMAGYGMSVRCIKDCTTPHQPAAIIGADTICAGSTATWHIAPVDGALSYTWELPQGWTGSSNGDTITVTAGTTSGTITVRANGNCDTGQSQALTVHLYPDPVVTITVNADTLATSMPFSSYQWYRDATLLAGETNPFHIVTANGNYTVEVTDDNGCTGISDSYTITNVHVRGMDRPGAVRVYPNPARDVLHIRADAPVKVAISGMDGKLLLQRQVAGRLELDGIPAGLYILQVRDEAGNLLLTEKLSRLP